ncbi:MULTISPECIES: PaaI family thioesterase [Protofrankia]|uniref:Thioesterase n=1 Tax=Protofrankia coriariae TaxID=1562887 RepID=A0ABR5F888_9ACTN|nr:MULTISPECIES: PaaI family thioesterase [Protofrankia]KLL12936.1 thioesterase [Protofrankia coriariae]ONH36456.1 thioesterase [Protofrankia sp. BMG5.30]
MPTADTAGDVPVDIDIPRPPGEFPADEHPGEAVEVPWSAVADYRCFGCSPHNERGLQLRLRTHPEGIQARFRFGRAHESYPGVVHGGLTGVVCDEVMGNLIVLRTGLTAFTTTMKVRYILPLLVGTTYDCVARIRTEDEGRPARRLVHASAEVLSLNGDAMATATASYQLVSIQAARRHLALDDADTERLRAVMSEHQNG